MLKRPSFVPDNLTGSVLNSNGDVKCSAKWSSRISERFGMVRMKYVILCWNTATKVEYAGCDSDLVIFVNSWS